MILSLFIWVQIPADNRQTRQTAGQTNCCTGNMRLALCAVAGEKLPNDAKVAPVRFFKYLPSSVISSENIAYTGWPIKNAPNFGAEL